jgi:hypothetical protein
MAKVSDGPLFPNLGPPGIARQIAGDGVALKSTAHPVGSKLHGNRSIHKAALETVEVKVAPVIKKRGRGRPRSTNQKPWEAEGISKALWYRRRKAEKEQAK